MSDERISRLEDVVKHLAQLEMDRVEYSDPDLKMSMPLFAEKEQKHRTVFQKFLFWIAG